MTTSPADFIEGAEQVVEHYGAWPTFHDADYVTVKIEMDGPTVSINFRLYDWDDVAQKANRPSISLCWHEVEGLSLVGIQELGQNAVMQMEITGDGNGIDTLIQTTWDGTNASFHAKYVEVTHFNPHEEWDYETRNAAVD